MTKWAASQRKLLTGMLRNLDEADKQIAAIDVDKDIKSFSEGAQDVWGLNRMRSTSAITVPEQSPAFLEGKIDPLPEDPTDSSSNAQPPTTPKLADRSSAPPATPPGGALSVTVTAPPPSTPSTTTTTTTTTTTATPTPSASPAPAPIANGTHTTPANSAGLLSANTTDPSASPLGAGGSGGVGPLSPNTVLIPVGTGWTAPKFELQFLSTVPGWNQAQNISSWSMLSGATGKEDLDEPAPEKQPHRSLLSYTMQLWGSDGWNRALEQAVASKHMYKEAIAALEEWANITSAVAKKLEMYDRDRSLPSAIRLNRASSTHPIVFCLPLCCV